MWRAVPLARGGAARDEVSAGRRRQRRSTPEQYDLRPESAKDQAERKKAAEEAAAEAARVKAE